MRLDSIEEGRALQEGFLKVFLVHETSVNAEVHLHLSDCLQKTAIDHFAGALLVNEEQNHLQESVSDAGVTSDVIAEELQAEFVYSWQALMNDVHTILEVCVILKKIMNEFLK